MSVFVYVDGPIRPYAYRVQPQQPNDDDATTVYNDGATCLSCAYPRARLSPVRHGFFTKGFAPTRMVVRDASASRREDCGAMQPRNARVQDRRPKKKPPAQSAGGGGTPREVRIVAAIAADRATPRGCYVSQCVTGVITGRGCSRAQPRAASPRRTCSSRSPP